MDFESTEKEVLERKYDELSKKYSEMKRINGILKRQIILERVCGLVSLALFMLTIIYLASYNHSLCEQIKLLLNT